MHLFTSGALVPSLHPKGTTTGIPRLTTTSEALTSSTSHHHQHQQQQQQQPCRTRRTSWIRIPLLSFRTSPIARFRESSSDSAPATTQMDKKEDKKDQMNEGEPVPSLATEQLGAPPEPALSPSSPEWAQHQPVTTVDKQDEKTKDNWIPRNPQLQRLTGRHPLNAEPTTKDLVNAGFITPASLHYVRNHGAVPKIQWEDHRLDITGLVGQPLTLSMDELASMPSITIPVTIVCSGNRRKEVNMMKKSIGYNWGTSAVSTAYWTGVRLRDLLLHAGVKEHDVAGKFVWFRGPTKELPKGSDGSYGTSMLLAHALDPAADVLVAYKLNGRWLPPDHGFPLRMVIPGWIGGRMVKWLSEVRVEDHDTDSHYHIHDNRMMPAGVDEEHATKDDWWHNRDTLTTELNVNSAFAAPDNDEVLMLSEGNKPYTLKGYAYAGGGRRVVRVEVSMDHGATWRLADIKRFEEPNAYGKYWCWVHWECEVATYDFFRSEAMVVRAWDSAFNTQPDTLAWNVMGLMNNCAHKVLILPHMNDRGDQGVRFQHPAPIERGALGHIGWREEQHQRQLALEQAGIIPKRVPQQPSTQAPSAPATPQTKDAKAKDEDGAATQAKGGRKITMAEVEKHNSRETRTWFIKEGKVYDPTPFLDQHPGGADAILSYGGQDATEEVLAIHSQSALKMMEKYYIGDLVDDSEAPEAGAETAADQQPSDGKAKEEDKAQTKEEGGEQKQAKGGRKITKAEVEKHNSREAGAWFIKEGKVYDPTPFLDQHPGGADAILSYAGEDATEEINAIHSESAQKMMEKYYIGDLVDSAEEAAGGSETAADQQQEPSAKETATESQAPDGELITLNPRQKVTLSLAERIEVNHDTRLFRFALPSPGHKLGLPIGSHVMLYAKVEDKLVIRPYTPISSDDDLGHMDLLIKVYFPRPPNIPGGKMTQYLDAMKPGDTIDVKGPAGHFKYEGKGQYSVQGATKGTATHLSMLAGGTGLTPMYQIIQAVLKDKEDNTQISLLYANKTEDDILMREELDHLAQQFPRRFKVWYVCDTAGPNWPFTTGRATEQLMRDKLFPAGDTTLGLMCGPPGLQDHVAKPGYEAMGYDQEHTITF